MLRTPIAAMISRHSSRDELEIVHDHLGQADEILGAQHVVLRGDAGGAIVEVADPQVLAAQRDHGRGAEAEALGADDRRLDHVEPGLQAAVGLQAHAMAQLVGAQRLMRLGEPQFPGRAGVLDRGQRTRAGAAIVAADRDQIGVGLGDARRHRADAGLGHELDRHQRARIDLLQIEDQLREILDRVDVVVRRRRNQSDARAREAQARDHLVDLVPRQLAALAGLRALRDLDLQHLGIDQVFRRDAEAPRGDLLDLGILLGAVAHRVLAALARVRARAEAVHRDRERLVRLGRQRSQGHAGAVEAREIAAAGSTSSSGIGARFGVNLSRSRMQETGRSLTSSRTAGRCS
jgi:hypothetical protein